MRDWDIGHISSSIFVNEKKKWETEKVQNTEKYRKLKNIRKSAVQPRQEAEWKLNAPCHSQQ